MTKIIQITDLHVDKAGEKPFDIDIRKNFTDILRAVREEEPDYLVITGDLCYDIGIRKTYKWLFNRLDLQDFPVEVIAGNHDDSKIIAEVFKLEHLLTEDEIFFAKKLGKKTCLFLDSAKGYLSERQLNWLQRQLKNHKRDLFVFMHHPPFKMGMPFMDKKHAIKDSKILKEIFFAYPGNIQVFCGHYHIDKTLQFKNVTIYSTPSCFYQLSQKATQFKVAHHRIAMRIIEANNQQISTYLRYFPGNKLY